VHVNVRLGQRIEEIFGWLKTVELAADELSVQGRAERTGGKLVYDDVLYDAAVVLLPGGVAVILSAIWSDDLHIGGRSAADRTR